MTSGNPAFQRDGPVAVEALLAWYDRHRRRLPWRADAGQIPDPYRVWLSEIMLQQTTVAAVVAYYRRFIDRWPNIEALAAASLDEVLEQWAGLGYYARARNLHACARKLVNDLGCRFPDSEDDLRALPGVGAYTAAAIAAIAFGRPAAAVDGNVERVIARLAAVDLPLPEAKPAIRTAVKRIVPAARPGDFAQALMDLGAMICTPRRPLCHLCPCAAQCAGYRLGIAESLPRRRPPRPRPIRRGTAFWIEQTGGAVLLRRRAESGLLGGMLEVPSTEWTEAGPADSAAAAPVEAQWTALATPVEHTFTHFHLVLDIWRASHAADDHRPADGDYRWAAPGELHRLALPSVMRKVVAAVRGPQALKPPPRQ